MKLFAFSGAAFCFMGVLAGALGAHALTEHLTATGGLNNYRLATDYMFYHGLALILVAYAADRFSQPPFQHVGWLFIAGSLLFQGNLYLISLAGIRTFSRLTPVGGSLLMIGWVLFAVYALRIRRSKE